MKNKLTNSTNSTRYFDALGCRRPKIIDIAKMAMNGGSDQLFAYCPESAGLSAINVVAMSRVDERTSATRS
ncbi:MAG: hypothetical protein ACKOEH_03910, partial [Actinomycetota bacterium]